MSTPIRTRLIQSYLIVLLLGMSLAGILVWRSVESLYLQTQQENLLAQAETTAALLQGQPLPNTAVEPYSQTSNVMPGIHTRVLGEQGAVIIGLPIAEGTQQLQTPPSENRTSITPEELLSRPEIQQALQGKASTAIRRIASVQNRRVLYAAAPIPGADGKVTGLVYLATPLPAAGIPANLLRDLIMAALVAIILSLLVGTIIARRIAHPVENIYRGAASIASGNLNINVPSQTGIGELDNLGKVFNEMTESIKQSNQAKNAFVADVTHELRTPLTVIKGTIETLEDGALDDTVGRAPLLASMHRETDRLIRLVNDLLVITRADAGMLNLQFQSVDLVDLARSRCDHFSPLASRNQIQYEVLTPQSSEPLLVKGDADRLAQVFDNLLDNAVRYSPLGSTITIEIRREENDCLCSVHDCGPGISVEHLPFIFERFYRADTSRHRQTGGVGLGLAIARSLILAHSGRITVDSSPGCGTTFHFALPVCLDCLPIA